MSIKETLEELFEKYGAKLLTQPLRIEGFLKDLHPEDPRAVFLLCEALFSGMVKKITQKKILSERERQKISLDFVSCSGIAVLHACWAIETWADILPSEAYARNNETETWRGTLEEVLRPKSLKE